MPDTPDIPDTPVAQPVVSSAATEPAPSASAGDRLVPVTEAIRYRKRAQAAEQQRDGLQQRVTELETELAQMRHAAAEQERRQTLDALLSAAGAIDLEAARLLAQAHLAEMSPPDPAQAVAHLQRRKPWLFARREPSPPAARMPARSDAADAPLDQAALQASRSGDRRDLLHYLRLRRAR